MAKSKNRSWIQQHVKDPYVLQSQRDGYRSRASYKLLEIVEKNRLIRPGMTVVDLGSTPGGWSQVAARMVGHEGRVHALDILPMDPIAGVDFIQGDFTEEDTKNEIREHVKTQVNVVMSDMAVNTTGIKNIDSIQTGELCKEAMFFAKDLLKDNGYFISKIFMGGTFNEIVAEGKKYFKEVKVFKPKSSRKDSKESFIICSKLR